jgi:hypothetical protein
LRMVMSRVEELAARRWLNKPTAFSRGEADVDRLHEFVVTVWHERYRFVDLNAEFAADLRAIHRQSHGCEADPDALSVALAGGMLVLAVLNDLKRADLLRLVCRPGPFEFFSLGSRVTRHVLGEERVPDVTMTLHALMSRELTLIDSPEEVAADLEPVLASAAAQVPFAVLGATPGADAAKAPGVVRGVRREERLAARQVLQAVCHMALKNGPVHEAPPGTTP